MRRRSLLTGLSAITAACVIYPDALAFGQETDSLALPAPRMTGGMPVMEALKNRQSIRDISSKPLPLQALSNLLWAAFGVNRPESGRRTAPSARNNQEIDVYVALAEGVYRYEGTTHALILVSKSDIRALTGGQDYVKEAAINLVYVADFGRMAAETPTEKKFIFSAVSAGSISQNVYLYCASEGLATVVRAAPDNPELITALKLRPEQKIILTQTAGFRKE